MRKRATILITVLIIFSFVIDYRIINRKKSTIEQSVISDNSNSTNLTENTGEKEDLTIWTYFEGLEWSVRDFNQKYPSIKVKVEVFNYENYTDKCLKAIAKGEGADIIIFDSQHIEAFNGNEAMENLLELPFNAGQYEKDFTNSLWRLGMSFDGERLIGIPYDTTPMVTFYRADIMEEYGFPSEPQKLAAYMKEENNWLRIAEALKKDNKWIAQWATDPLKIYETGTGIFDENLNFIRNNSDFRKAVDITRKVKMQGLALNADIWSEEGQSALRDGRLAMLHLGTWGGSHIKGLAPEQSGRWRVTALPFGISGWNNSTFIAINSFSKNKEDAWTFIRDTALNTDRYYGEGVVPAYLPSRNKLSNSSFKDDYYGGQDIAALYRKLTAAMKEPIVTPIDDKAEAAMYAKVQNGITGGISSEEILRQLDEELVELIQKDKEALLKSLGK